MLWYMHTFSVCMRNPQSPVHMNGRGGARRWNHKALYIDTCLSFCRAKAVWFSSNIGNTKKNLQKNLELCFYKTCLNWCKKNSQASDVKESTLFETRPDVNQLTWPTKHEVNFELLKWFCIISHQMCNYSSLISLFYLAENEVFHACKAYLTNQHGK